MKVKDFSQMDTAELDFKKHKGDQIVTCFCDRYDEILVGNVLYKYINIFVRLLFLGSVLLILYFFLLKPHIILALFFGLCLCGGLIMPLWYYSQAIKFMQKNGHNDFCSRKISKMATMRFGQNARFMILNYKEKNNETSTK